MKSRRLSNGMLAISVGLIPWVEADASTRAVPSGGAFATMSAPILPEAPEKALPDNAEVLVALTFTQRVVLTVHYMVPPGAGWAEHLPYKGHLA